MADTTAAPVAAAKVPTTGEWTTGILDVGDDIVTALIGYCLPCVLYGQTAEKVHGGDMVNHCLKFYLYSCFCGCGLVSGPTRKAIRTTYGLPVQPSFLAEQGQADCLTGTIPCVACFALCQDFREISKRNPAAPIKPEAFTWGIPADNDTAPAATAAPAQQEIAKE